MQQYMPLDLSTNWEMPQVIRAKSIRTLVLSGTRDHETHGLLLRKPLGLIELIGSRSGLYSTIMLAVFGRHVGETPPKFAAQDGAALGIMHLPSESFAAFLQMVSGPSVYFRMGASGDANAIATDMIMLQS